MGWLGFGRKDPPTPPPAAVTPATQPATPTSEPLVARETPAELPPPAPQPAPQSDRPYFPDPLSSAEQELIATRRAAVDRKVGEAKIGVGLSGGGIRSATFCFGIFTALARKLPDDLPPLFTR